MLRKRAIIVVAVLGLARPALAGPPYVSDDPEPTDYKHFEIFYFQHRDGPARRHQRRLGYRFQLRRCAGSSADRHHPPWLRSPRSERTSFGLSNVELAAKYRFLHQDSFGLDVSVFPRVFLPSPSKSIGNNTASLLLPVWVQKDWSGGWSAFGGGGCVVNGRSAQDYCLTGGVVTYQLLPKLQLGVELFHQTPDGTGTPAATSLGIGARYDINDTYHLLGYVRRGIRIPTRPINIPGTPRYCLRSEIERGG